VEGTAVILRAIVVSSPNNPDSSRKRRMVERRQNGRRADKLYLREKLIINTTETEIARNLMCDKYESFIATGYVDPDQQRGL